MKKKKGGLSTKKFLITGIVVCAGILSAIFWFVPKDASIPHQNTVDTKISQYSDRYITVNAVTTNPQFKKIAFNVSVPSNPSFTSNQLASLADLIKFFTENFFKTKTSLPKEYGTWVWTPTSRITPEYTESILTGVQKDGVDTVYLSIDSYLDIFTMPDGAEKNQKREEFTKIIDNFIARANQKGIRVDAEAGWQNWAESGNEYKAFAVTDYVKNFNATHKNKFRGFQYDIEPYLMDAYQNNSAQILTNFVGLVDKTEYYLGTSTLQLSVVVPDFYDKKDKATPKFAYGGQNGYIFDHLIKILDRRQNSSIIIMSYRNFADGKDGSIGVSANEMRTAKSNAQNTKIVIAQETGDVTPPYITFYSTSKKNLLEQVAKIDSAFKSNPNFGGIAIHYANAFLALK